MNRKEPVIRIETSRLVLRDWKEDDILPFAAMNSNSAVMKYFLKSLNEKESLDFYNRIQDEFSKYGYGYYAVEKRLSFLLKKTQIFSSNNLSSPVFQTIDY